MESPKTLATDVAYSAGFKDGLEVGLSTSRLASRDFRNLREVCIALGIVAYMALAALGWLVIRKRIMTYEV